VCIKLQDTKGDFLERVKLAFVENQFSFSPRRRDALLNARKERGEPTLFFYTRAEGALPEELPLQAINQFIAGIVFQTLHRAFFPQVRPFPTERTTFVTFPFSPAGSGQVTIKTDAAPQQEREIKLLSVPLRGFLGLMEDVFRISRLERNIQAEKKPSVQVFLQLAELLEREILGGSVDLSSPEPEPWREILFQPGENIALEIPIVSSMVKELSPLVLYLRYMAEPDEWLVIDEPEMNLHPKAQVQLVEFLAMLVNAGLQVLFTTHSPYIVDHLVNLMKAAQHKDKEAIRDKFYLKRVEAFIPREQVSVYLFERGAAKNILDEEGIIDWGTFGDVSDQISDLYFEI